MLPVKFLHNWPNVYRGEDVEARKDAQRTIHHDIRSTGFQAGELKIIESGVKHKTINFSSKQV